MYDVTIFGLNFTINPVAFTVAGWEIYWYGIIIATGFLGAILYGILNAKRFGIDVDKMLDVVLVTAPVAILCARAYYVIFDGEKLKSFGDFFGFGNNSGFSGLAIYGGVIGAFTCGYIMCKIKKVNIPDIFDLASIGFLIGQGIGRWGNFFNQEAYGTFTNSIWWGMASNRTEAELGAGLVHPCFLYESIWCLIGVFVLHKLSKNRKFSGQLILTYGIWYGFERGFLELIRTDSLMIGNLRVSSLLSFVICITCAVLMYVILKKEKQKQSDTEYVGMFDVDEDKALEIVKNIEEDVTITEAEEDGKNN